VGYSSSHRYSVAGFESVVSEEGDEK